jgi:hypothetical protein
LVYTSDVSIWLRKVRKRRGGTFASNLMIGFLTFDLSMPVTENII